jgi:hypothetical protein
MLGEVVTLLIIDKIPLEISSGLACTLIYNQLTEVIWAEVICVIISHLSYIISSFCVPLSEMPWATKLWAVLCVLTTRSMLEMPLFSTYALFSMPLPSHNDMNQL